MYFYWNPEEGSLLEALLCEKASNRPNKVDEQREVHQVKEHQSRSL
jgi:hypothetical protein